MTKEIVVRNGFVQFWRLGRLSFANQNRWLHAPESSGMWAFPWPFFDYYYAAHQHYDILPKKLANEGTPEEISSWLKNVAPRVVPLRKFWYRGDVYSHMAPLSQKGDDTLMRSLSSWGLIDVERFAVKLRTTGYQYGFETGQYGQATSYRASIDHMEVFIPRGRGIIRSTPKV